MGGRAPARHRQDVPRLQPAHAVLELHVADQRARRAGGVAPHHQGRVPHPGAGAQRRLDLAGLDAVAAQLDLLVLAALEFQKAVRPAPRQVAGAVGAAGRIVGIDPEGAGGELRVAPVAQRDVPARHQHFAGIALRHRRAGLVDQRHLAVRHAPAHRQARARRPHRLVHEPARVQRPAFGGAQVHAEQGPRPAAAADHVQVPPADPLAPQHHQPEVVQPLARAQRLHHVAEQGGRAVDHRRAAGPELAHHPLGAQLHRRHQLQRASGQQRGQHDVQPGDGGRRIEHRQPVLRVGMAGVDQLLGVVQHPPVALEHPLRLAGGAGGVEDVGDLVGIGIGRGGGRRQRLQVEHLQLGAEQGAGLRGQGPGRDHPRRAGVAGDAGVALQRVVGVQRDAGPPRAHRPQRRGDEAVVVWRQHRDRPRRRQPRRGRRDPGAQRVQLGVADLEVPLADRRAAGEAAGGLGELAVHRALQRRGRQRLVRPVGRASVIERQDVHALASAAAVGGRATIKGGRPRASSGSAMAR